MHIRNSNFIERQANQVTNRLWKA